jgi:hypothetical protein
MNKIVEIARKEAGYIEAAGNKTKYGKWFGLDGVAWCGMFVSWCYFQAGKPLPKIGFLKGFAGCQTAHVYFKKNGWITTTPVAGDIVLFDWNKDGRYDHTGIFEGWINDTKFETIEGNTSPLNNSNGGEVMKRIRNKSVAIFIHPPFND